MRGRPPQNLQTQQADAQGEPLGAGERACVYACQTVWLRRSVLLIWSEIPWGLKRHPIPPTKSASKK